MPIEIVMKKDKDGTFVKDHIEESDKHDESAKPSNKEKRKTQQKPKRQERKVSRLKKERVQKQYRKELRELDDFFEGFEAAESLLNRLAHAIRTY